jgi:hypothetical protein
VAAEPYKKNHVASACYTQAFADESGDVGVLRRSGQRHHARPRAVGFRTKFWGADAALRQQAEEAAGRVETAAGPLVPRVPALWPLRPGSDERFQISALIALHTVRTPAFRREMIATGEQLLRDNRAKYEDGLTHEQYARVLAELRSDRQMAATMIGNIPKMASLVGSAHWSLIRFPRPWLLTADHAVAVMPISDQTVVAVKAVPDAGFGSALEFRFALDPRHLLVACWLDEPDDHAVIDGDYTLACDNNLALAAQAEAELFHHPAQIPPFFTPPWLEPKPPESIAARLHAGYGPASARDSERRRRAIELVENLIEHEITDRIETVSWVRNAA